MRKVLIVTHLVRASPRITGLAKYLPEYGWQPIVLTPPRHMGHSLGRSSDRTPRQYRAIEAPYFDALSRFSELLKKWLGFDPQGSIGRQADRRFGTESSKSGAMGFLLRFFKEVFYYPDQDRGWKTPAVEAGSRVLVSEAIDAMISSSSPVTSHIVAKALKKRYGLPWVADLRDLWSQNHNYPYRRLRRVVDSWLELKTLSPANALVTVSEPLRDRLRMLHRGKAVFSVPNGFDPDEVNKEEKSLTTKFTVTYTGQIYRGKQVPSRLLVALKSLISEGAIDPDDIEVRFYGYEEAWLEREIERQGLSEVVRQHGEIPREAALGKQRESQVLLLLNFEDPAEKGTYTLKIFEYLAAQRPILVTGGFDDDVKEKMLRETKAGFYTKDAREIKETLMRMYSEFKDRGRVGYFGDEKEINRYSHREMARRFAEILDRLAGS